MLPAELCDAPLNQRWDNVVEQPMLHYWKTHPEAAKLPPERILELHLAVSEVLIPPLVAVVANHIETNTPIVLEGTREPPRPIRRGSARRFHSGSGTARVYNRSCANAMSSQRLLVMRSRGNSIKVTDRVFLNPP